MALLFGDADAEAPVAHPRPHTAYSRMVSNQIKTENKEKNFKKSERNRKVPHSNRTKVQKGKSSTGGTNTSCKASCGCVRQSECKPFELA